MAFSPADVTRALAPIAPEVLGAYLWGSRASGRAHSRSDIDVCIVAGPGVDPSDVLRRIWTEGLLGAARYDVKVFEDLPLYLQGEVLDTGRLLFSRDEPALSEYLRPFQKRWADQAHRNRPNPEDMERILAARRARG